MITVLLHFSCSGSYGNNTGTYQVILLLCVVPGTYNSRLSKILLDYLLVGLAYIL